MIPLNTPNQSLPPYDFDTTNEDKEDTKPKSRDNIKIIDERVETLTSKMNGIEKENLSHTQNQQNDSYVVIKLYMYNEYKF